MYPTLKYMRHADYLEIRQGAGIVYNAYICVFRSYGLVVFCAFLCAANHTYVSTHCHLVLHAEASSFRPCLF